MRKYVIYSFVIVVVLFILIFLVAEDHTNIPFLYGLF
jgi:hypothetical protein